VKSHATQERLNRISSWWKSDVVNAQGAEDDVRFTHTATSRTTGFDLDNHLSGDETNFSAKTRVYVHSSDSGGLLYCDFTDKEIKSKRFVMNVSSSATSLQNCYGQSLN